MCEIIDHARAGFIEALTVTNAFDPGVEKYNGMISKINAPLKDYLQFCLTLTGLDNFAASFP